MTKWRENLFYRLLSVALALGLWWYVSGQQNPVTERVFTVPLEVRGLDDQLVVAEKPGTVQIRAQGSKKMLQDISSTEIDAWADLRGLRAGQRIVEVGVMLPRGINLVNVMPAQVSIVLDQITEVQLPIKINMDRVSAGSGYKILVPQVSPAFALISGPQKVLEEIKEVFVEPRAERLNADFSGSWPIQVQNDRRENLQEWLKLLPQTAEVFVPIVPDLPSKKLQVAVSLEGELPEGFELAKKAVVPETINVYAPQNLLSEINTVNTRAVDISRMTASQQLWVDLDLPSGAFSSVGRKVKVLIDITPAETTNGQ